MPFARITFALALSLIASSTLTADQFDATLRFLGHGTQPIDEVIESVNLSGSQRLAERLLSRIPDIHPRTAARHNQRARLELALLANPERLGMPAADRNDSILASAVSGGAVDVVRFLLERELDTKNEKAQLDRAIRENREAVVAVFCEFERCKPILATALHDACWQGKRAIAKRIIATGVDVTVARSWGFQAVHAAMFRRDTEMVDLLLKNGAAVDVNIAAGLGRLAQMNELMKAGIPSRFRNSVGPHPAYFAARADEMTTLQPFLTDRNVVRRTGHRRFNLLIAACETASGDTVKRILESGIARDDTAILYDDKQAHALHFAASQGNMEAASALVKAGVDVDVTTERGATPLIVAVDFGKVEMVRHLIELGANVDAVRNDTESALWVAASRGRLEIAKLLLDKGATVDGAGKSPLRQAVINGRVDVAKLLLERGSIPLATAVGVPDEKVTVTPLGLAALRDIRLVEMFLETGQDPNRIQGDPEAESTPVQAAVRAFRPANALRLMKAGGRVRPKRFAEVLYFAGRNGNVELLDALLESGVSLRAVNQQGNEIGLQALVRGAIEADRKDIIRHVASKGINLDIRLAGTHSALSLAASRNAKQATLALLECGASPEALSFPGARRPIELAMSPGGGFDVVRMLVEHGAEPLHTGGHHLVTAAALGDSAHVAKLLTFGYGVDGPDDNGQPLAVAVTNGRLEIARLLVDRGASPDIRDAAGRTPLHHAVESGTNATKLVELLLASGADPLATDYNGTLPLHLAAAGRHTDVVNLLQPRTPVNDLHLAAALGDMEKVNRALAEDSAALLVERAPLGTPLFWAATAGRSRVLRRLIEVGGATSEFRDAMPRIVESGDVELVDFLAEHGVSVNGPSNKYGEPLRIAIHLRRPDLVRTLLDHRANPNASNGSRGWTPLQRAATRGLPEITEMLIDAGAHVNATGYDKWSALGLALNPSAYASGPMENTRNTRGTDEGKLAVARILLDAGARGRVGQQGMLSYAAEQGAGDIVERLIATGADVNHVAPRGRTPLVALIENRLRRTRTIKDEAERTRRDAEYLEIVDALLEAGADPTKEGRYGGTPLEAAMKARDTVLIERIQQAVGP